MKNTECLTPRHKEIAELITWIFMSLLIADICSDSGGPWSTK